ncbi:coiled-coil domain-containing protein 149-like [Babylonia areolata]|uniref:coiled-coil domain-containing protein 149-like n=1 Tax=Babylonia areolata TaxID=304850 RepID=UPI003FD21C83
MAVADAPQLSARLEALTTEYQVCRQKLESKCEALLILSRELAECRSERDQFKLMAEQLRERYQVLKRQLAGHRPMSPSHDDLSCNVDLKQYATTQGQGLAQVLMEYREQNKCLQIEVDDLKQKLQDAQGDIKLLREQIVRSRVGTTDEGMTTRHFPAYEREDLVKQLEAAREQTLQLERDLQQVLDEKQELVTERDAYKHKHGRLNTELNYILKGDEKGVVDIDAVIMENKYLQERLKQMEEEKCMAMETVSKYKSILEKKKNKGILKVGQNRSGGLIITQRQVQQMMQNNSAISPTPQAMADLQALCSALLDSVNDKSMALSHQRKANKILGNRVSELEKKLKTLEVAGLWSVSEHVSSLEKLRKECSEVKMLVPCQRSESSEASDRAHDAISDLDSTDSVPQTPSVDLSPSHGPLGRLSSQEVSELMGREERSEAMVLGGEGGRGGGGGVVGSDMEADLDLLPTKEEVVKHVSEECGEGVFRDHSSLQDLEHLSLSPSDHDHDTEERPSNPGMQQEDDDDEEADDDESGAEQRCLLGEAEDKDTARQLKNFMESVTAKILEQNHHTRGGPLPLGERDPSPRVERRDPMVVGTEAVTQLELTPSQACKEPLLQEMSEPVQEHDVEQKSVEC